MKGVRVEILAEVENLAGEMSRMWLGHLCWYSPVCREEVSTPEYDHLDEVVGEKTRKSGLGMWAYPMDHYRRIRPYIRRRRKAAKIAGLKTRTICGEITPVDNTQGILRRQGK